jgi:hypothetical protein
MKVELKNQLPALLKARGIRSATAFGKRLTGETGHALSTSQATRYLKDDPPAFTREFVAAACEVLQCFPSELYAITITLGAEETLDPALEVPHHTVVLREPADPDQPPPEEPVPGPQRVGRDGTQRPDKQEQSISNDTGPSPTIFPGGE